jgi:hypothetical protein
VDQIPPNSDGRTGLTTPVIIALIGAAATILAALLTGFFGLARRDAPPAVPAVAPASAPTVTLEGPAAAPLGELTFFTIISSNAERAVWSIGGFNNNERIEITPLSPSHQIQIEPTDADRVGDTFALVVTVYDSAGTTATASRPFVITAPDE